MTEPSFATIARALVLLLAAGLSPAAAQTGLGPGETSGPPLAPLLVTGFDPATEDLRLTYQSACNAVDNNVYFGPLDRVSTLGWSGSSCGIGTGGALSSFNPGRGSFFFVVVGNDGPVEGSYGRADLGGTPVERAAYAASACPQVQDLADACAPRPAGGACASSADCAARESCIATGATGGGVCECLGPFGGPYCEECAPGFDGPGCRECETGWISNAFEFSNDEESVAPLEQQRCDPDVPGNCDGRTCSGRGTCRVIDRDAVCACDAGYAGPDCSECAPDFAMGTTGECVPSPACREAKCGGHGDCVLGPFGDVSCTCDRGFSGVDCGGPDLAIRTAAETRTLYDGETILLEPAGTGPFAWELLSGPARIVPCPSPTLHAPDAPEACPFGAAELTIIAPAGGIADLTLVQVALSDAAGHTAGMNLAALPPTVLPITGTLRGELFPFYSAMLKYMRARGIRGGVLGISKGGQIVGTNGYGYRDPGIDADPFVNAGEGGPLVQPDSPFRLASVSKTLTAAAVRQRAAQAGVNIFSSTQANRASTWVQASTGFSLTGGAPPFDYNLPAPLTTDPRWANVTIAHLLNHHAGFLRDSIQPSTTGQPAYDAGLLPFTEDLMDPSQLQAGKTGASSQDISYATMYAVAALQLQFDPRPTVEQMIRFVAGTQLGYNPGGSFGSGDNYSNMGYILAGRVLEGVQGVPYDPDHPGVTMGWGSFAPLLQNYLCETSGIQSGVFPGGTVALQPGEPYYRDLDWQGNESREWNLAEGADKIRWNAGIQQWQFCQSGCPDQPGAVWNDDENTPSPFGGIWLAERNSAGGLVATTSALLKFARNHRIKVGSPNDATTGIGSLLPMPGTHTSSSSHNGSLPGTRSWLWQMFGNRTNRIPFDAGAWNDDPSAPLDLDDDGAVLVNETTLGFTCTLPSDVVVAVMFNQRQDRRAPNGNVSSQSNSSNGTIYGRILDYLGDAACEVNQGGWPVLSDPPAVLGVVPTCN